MITRFYRVRIKPELRDEFEPLFKTVAFGSVSKCQGCRRVVIGGPTAHSPDEYAMITEWVDEATLSDFAGPDWTVPHIPEGMEKFVAECRLHHFHHMDQPA